MSSIMLGTSNGDIWFTADHHFGHRLMVKMRGFESGLEMDKELISRWNSRVKKGDTVIHLGDVALCSKRRASEIIGNLNGKITLVRGNHDKTADSTACRGLFESVHDALEVRVRVNNPLARKGHPLRIWLFHYPCESWPASYWGTIHLHGHSHGNARKLRRRLDVGVDCHGLEPISLDEVLDKIKEGEHEVSGG